MRIDLRRNPGLLATAFGALLWLLAFACYRAPGVATGHSLPRETLYLAATAAVGFAFSVLFYFLAVRHRWGLANGPRVALAGATLVVLVGVHAWIDLLMVEHVLRAKIVIGDQARVTWQGLLILNNVLTLAPAYVTYGAGLGVGLSLRAVHEREQRLGSALAATQEAQLAALRFQINPHFLFNSLNACVALVGSGRNDDAVMVMTRLADFFRGTLARDPDAMVTLEEELDGLGAYLDIETARFGDRLRVEIELPEDLASASLPHFLLQPLAENAIKHGVAPTLRRVTLSVTARAVEGRLAIAVRDDGAGGADSEAGEGIGLRNVAARLAAHYGDAASFRATALAQGFLVELVLPLSFCETDA